MGKGSEKKHAGETPGGGVLCPPGMFGSLLLTVPQPREEASRDPGRQSRWNGEPEHGSFPHAPHRPGRMPACLPACNASAEVGLRG